MKETRIVMGTQGQEIRILMGTEKQETNLWRIFEDKKPGLSLWWALKG